MHHDPFDPNRFTDPNHPFNTQPHNPVYQHDVGSAAWKDLNHQKDLDWIRKNPEAAMQLYGRGAGGGSGSGALGILAGILVIGVILGVATLVMNIHWSPRPTVLPGICVTDICEIRMSPLTEANDPSLAGLPKAERIATAAFSRKVAQVLVRVPKGGRVDLSSRSPAAKWDMAFVGNAEFHADFSRLSFGYRRMTGWVRHKDVQLEAERP